AEPVGAPSAAVGGGWGASAVFSPFGLPDGGVARGGSSFSAGRGGAVLRGGSGLAAGSDGAGRLGASRRGASRGAVVALGSGSGSGTRGATGACGRVGRAGAGGALGVPTAATSGTRLTTWTFSGRQPVHITKTAIPPKTR